MLHSASASDLLRISRFGKEAGLYDYTLKHVNPFDQDSWLNTTTAGQLTSYLTPGLGTVTSARDVWNNASQGNILGTLGSAGMMALSLVPGGAVVGGLARGGKALATGGKALMAGGRASQLAGKGLQTMGAAGTQAARGAMSLNRGAVSLNNTISQGIQKAVPLRQTTWKSVGPMSVPMNPIKSTINAGIKNPITTTSMLTSSGPPQPAAQNLPMTQPTMPIGNAAQQIAP